MRPAIILIALLLIPLTRLALADSNNKTPRMSAIVLDFEIRGDTSIESAKETDQ